LGKGNDGRRAGLGKRNGRSEEVVYILTLLAFTQDIAGYRASVMGAACTWRGPYDRREEFVGEG
jgi:hypothetical protein